MAYGQILKKMGVLTNIFTHSHISHAFYRPFCLSSDSSKLKIEFLSASLTNYMQQRFRRPPYSKKGPATRIVQFDYSGDLLKQGDIDGSTIHYAYAGIKELESAPDEVRKLFTLDFAEGNAVTAHRLNQIGTHIESKLGKDCELEKKIAIATIGVRNEIVHCVTCKKDTRAKARLIERIQYRKKKLKQLRSIDHERFVWILNELRIKYVRHDPYYVKPTKKEIRRKAVVDIVNAEKQRKIDELRLAFQKELEQFEEYKKRTVEEIETDMKELGLTDADVKQCIEDSVVKPEPDYRVMSRLEIALYEQKKERKAKEWKYVRESK